MSPYTLPEGQVQISFSGGLTSGYMLHEILQANGDFDPDRVKVLFQNTGREHSATLDFIEECSQRWSVKIHWLEYAEDEFGKPVALETRYESAARYGEPFSAFIRHERFLPSATLRTCTKQLKALTGKRWLVKQGWKNWVSAIGFRADEARRAGTSFKESRISRWYPLLQAGVSKADVHAFWKAQNWGLELPDVYGKNPYGNCDGCFLKSEAVLAQLSVDMPEKFSWWVAQEEETGRTFSKKRAYEDLRQFVSGKDVARLSEQGILCAADGGDCTG